MAGLASRITILAELGNLRSGFNYPFTGAQSVPRTPNPKLHALWRNRVRHQADSGLTVTQFCAQHGLRVKAFYAWKRRLRLADGSDSRPTLPATRGFVPVTVRLIDRASEDRLNEVRQVFIQRSGLMRRGLACRHRSGSAFPFAPLPLACVQ